MSDVNGRDDCHRVYGVFLVPHDDPHTAFGATMIVRDFCSLNITFDPVDVRLMNESNDATDAADRLNMTVSFAHHNYTPVRGGT